MKPSMNILFVLIEKIPLAAVSGSMMTTRPQIRSNPPTTSQAWPAVIH